MSTSLNLVRDPWLPVITAGGSKQMSIREVITNSTAVRELDELSPPEFVAIVRLLLAILLDAFHWAGGDEWAAAWRRGEFDSVLVNEYLDRHMSRFELFDDEAPFYQVARLEPSSPTGIKPVSLVMPEVASGNNTPLFSSLIDDQVPALTPAKAAVRLVALMGYDTAAIKTGTKGDPLTVAGKTTGNPTGPLGALGAVLAIGRNLFETLMLNYPLVQIEPADRAAWARDDGPQWERRAATGVLDLLTWQSRRVRLIPNKDGLVDRVIVAAGDRLEFTPLFEPHTLWRQTAAGAVVSQRPARHQPSRAPWRGLTSLLTLTPQNERSSTSLTLGQLGYLEYDGHLDPNYPLDVLSVGVVYGNMSAVVEDIISERISVPLIALSTDKGREVREAALGVADSADAVMNALNRLQGDLRRAGGGEPLPWDGGQRPGEEFAAAMGAPLRQLLRALQQGQPLPAPLAEWETEVRRIAEDIAASLLENAPESTFLGVVDAKNRINQAKAAVFFRGALNKALVRADEQSQLKENS